MKARAAIVGPGNIGTDLLFKLLRSNSVEPAMMVGVDETSEGLKIASEFGLETSSDGVDWLLDQRRLPDIVFEATSAYVHSLHAPLYLEAGIPVVDLTPAAVGPYVVPSVNLAEHTGVMNLNMVTCGGQATIPIVHAVRRVCSVPYAEIVATVASASAGPGTRQNIDEFTRTTASAVAQLGGAGDGKAIIILNPATPPLIMRDTIFCEVTDLDSESAVLESLDDIIREVQSYVPGYRLRAQPQFDETIEGSQRVVVFVEVEGAEDYLPKYAGNLDIMTAAAAQVGNQIAAQL